MRARLLGGRPVRVGQPATLGFMFGWLWVLFLNGPLLNVQAPRWGFPPERVFLVFMLTHSLSYLGLALAAKLIPPPEERGALVSGGAILAAAGSLFVGLAPAAAGPQRLLLAAAAAGLGSSAVMGTYIELYSRQSVGQVGLFFALATLLGDAVFLAIQRSPGPAAAVFCSLLPLVSACFLAPPRRQTSPPPADTPSASRAFALPTRFAAMVSTFYLAGGLMQRVAFATGHPASPAIYWLGNLTYGAVACAGSLSLFALPNLDLRLLYRPVLPLLGTAFLLLPFSDGNLYVLSCGVLFNAAFALFDAYTLLLFCFLAHRHPRPLVVVGWGYFAVTASIALGDLGLGQLFSALAVGRREAEAVALGAGLLLFAAAAVFRGEGDTFAGWKVPTGDYRAEPATSLAQVPPSATGVGRAEVAPTPRPRDARAEEARDPSLAEERTALPRGLPSGERPAREAEASAPQAVDRATLALLFSEHYGFTVKEREVFLLLVEGRNNPCIREALNISQNTLKTHLRNVYQKLHAGNRQEVITIFQQFSSLTAARQAKTPYLAPQPPPWPTRARGPAPPGSKRP